MKKFLSIVLSAVMLISVFSASTVAYAKKDPIYSPETTIGHIDITVTLNGESSNHTEYTQDKENDKIVTFTYTGDGILIGWDFDYNEYKLVEGVDYIIISQDENSITIQILDGYHGDNFWVNAIDEYPDESTTEASSTRENNSQKSPDTGASALGLGIMLAGSAILVASRKKHE